MKAKMISEFKRGLDPKVALQVGFGKRVLNSMSWKILDFIKEAGEEGRSFTEIQKFIWVELQGNDEGDFWEKSDVNYWAGPDQRKTRGLWTTQLYGWRENRYGIERNGLLTDYCRKNAKGKWVFVRYPAPRKNIYHQK